MLPVIPLIVIGLGVAGATKAHKHFRLKGKVTKDREDLFNSAMRMLEDPDKLRALAAAYDKEDLHAHAELLRKRAALRELPAEVKKQRTEAFRKGMASADPDAVSKLAKLFEQQGAIGSAAKLNEHAGALRAAQAAIKQANTMNGKAATTLATPTTDTTPATT